MIHSYEGTFNYNDGTIRNAWNSSSIGVYYLFEGSEIVYIGSGTGEHGIRGRLLVHLSENSFPYVNSFGYKFIDTVDETLLHEKSEIQRLNPKYNKQNIL